MQFNFRGSEANVASLREVLTRYFTYREVIIHARDEEEATAIAKEELSSNGRSTFIRLNNEEIHYIANDEDEIEVVDIQDCSPTEKEREIEYIKEELIEEFIANHEDRGETITTARQTTCCIAKTEEQQYQLMMATSRTASHVKQKESIFAPSHEKQTRNDSTIDQREIYSLADKLIWNKLVKEKKSTTKAEEIQTLMEQIYPWSTNRLISTTDHRSEREETEDETNGMLPTNIEDGWCWSREKPSATDLQEIEPVTLLAIGITSCLYIDTPRTILRVQKATNMGIEKNQESEELIKFCEIEVETNTQKTIEEELVEINKTLNKRGDELDSSDKKSDVMPKIWIDIETKKKRQNVEKPRDSIEEVRKYTSNQIYPCSYYVQICSDTIKINQTVARGSSMPQEMVWTCETIKSVAKRLMESDKKQTITSIITEYLTESKFQERKNKSTSEMRDEDTHSTDEQKTGGKADKIRIIDNGSYITNSDLKEIAEDIRGYLVSTEEKEKKAMLIMNTGANYIATIKVMIEENFHYLTCDSNYPYEKIRQCAEEFKPTYLIVDNDTRHLSEQLERHLANDALVITIACKKEHNKADSPGNVKSLADEIKRISDSSAKYSIYTSGSTGRPKEITQTIRNTLYFAQRYKELTGINSRSIITQIGAIAHDATIVDIYTAILSGCTILPYDIKRDGIETLINLVNEERINVLHCTPTVWREISYVATKVGKSVAPVQTLVLGGEGVTRSDIRTAKRLCRKDCKVINLYGSSEQSISFANIITGETLDEDEYMTIGKCIIDSCWKLINTEGIENPFVGELQFENKYTGKIAGEDISCYKTGDIMRRLSNGKLVHLGRTDNQVKVRGNRVSMEEVEQQLAEHPEINECCIVDYMDRMGNTELAAYIVVRRESSRKEPKNILEDIKNHLMKNVASYMVPTKIMTIDTMPKTSTGKMDRMKLREINRR